MREEVELEELENQTLTCYERFCTTMTEEITPKRFREIMEAHRTIEDKEHRHQVADQLMKKVLKQQGFEEGVEIFQKMSKWYS